MRRSLSVLAMAAALFAATAVLAVQPDEVLKDPAQEQRARALSADIRCLVCQNQSIDDSDAELARDLRLLIRNQIRQGRSNDQIRDFLVERYGAFVLLDPPMQRGTLLLWFGPLIVLVGGTIALAVFYRSRSRAAPVGDSLSDAERARVARLLDASDRDQRS